MQHPWLDWWRETAETLGVALAFAFGGGGFVLWSGDQQTIRRGLLVILAGQIVTAATVTFAFGYLKWSLFWAPVLGLVCGIVAMPLLNALMKAGNDRAADFVNAGLRKILGGRRDDSK